MDNRYWQARWEQDQIGFHQDSVSPSLLRYASELQLSPGARVFVPLCGKSHDMGWLAAQGYRVLGVEVSPIAVAAFFEEHGMKPLCTHTGEFEVWKSGRVEIYCGDFFALAADDLKSVAAVYDRAALIAMPDTLRERYVRHMHACLASPVRTLLITLDYPQVEMAGPPFAVSGAEIEALYGASHVIRELYAEDVLEKKPKYRDKGLSRLIERVSLLVPRA